MCGIAGFFDRSSATVRPEREARLRDQVDVLAHRGPDRRRVLNVKGAGLAHARLAVIDLSTEADQPMLDASGELALVFNGEIYNHLELRRELELRGHRFRTRSDTEVILEGYRAWDVGILRRLRGMFAIALHDGARGRLVLARDRIGKKPLVYAALGDLLLFASEIKGVLAWPDVQRRPDWSAIHDYLTFQYVPAPRTAFQGITKLAPGHLLVVDRERGPRIESYVSRPQPCTAPSRPSSELALELVDRLREATRLRLAADVPLGAFLSGGVDSSAVVAMMAIESGRPVKTFTIGFEEQSYDERPFARAVAERYRTDHQELVIRPDAMAVLPSIVWHYGEPFADSSAIPTYYVSEIARRSVTVALNGDGGDEGFLGYQRYAAFASKRAGVIAGSAGRELVAATINRLPGSVRRAHGIAAICRQLERPSGSPSRDYEQFIAYFSDAAKADIYGPHLAEHLARSSLGGLDRYLRATPEPAGAAAWADIHTYLPDDLLAKVDIASMAHGLECRSPLLDQDLIEWATTLPSEARLSGGETKSLLKLAMEPFLPRALLYRPKMGFGVPIDRWIRGPMRDFVYATLLEGPARGRGLFQLEKVRTLLDEHCRGIGNAPRIWALLMLELWLQMWIDGPVPSRPSPVSTARL